MTTPNLYGNGLVGPIKPPSRGPLADRFLMSPFSVWNTREGFWQDRRNRWLGLGIKSEEGRDDKLTYAIPETLADGSKGRKVEAQTSVFDPVVCELAYRWWCPPAGVVLDPFAGGSVRGVVASLMGRKYYGCELRGEQVAANRAQAAQDGLYGRWRPKWVEGDSYDTAPACPWPADMIFSCPPYGNLEVYSDHPADISNRNYDDFLDRYRAIIARASTRLKPDSFVVWVVANYRDKEQGKLLDFVGDTIQAWEDAGTKFYNDIILVNSVGSGAMRANTNFVRGGRKMVKLHQNVLVFVKGDHKAAAARVGGEEE